VFLDATYPSQLALLSLPFGGWGSGVYDLNNDGWKDLFAATSDVMDNVELFSSRRYKQPSQVYLNRANGTFIATATGLPRAHRGSGFADFDHDGRVDVVVSSLNERVEYLRNVTEPKQHWLAFALTGAKSNRDAIGASIRIGTQVNHVTTSVGYASSSSKVVHFGLGQATKANVEIRWPSGAVQKLENVAADQLLKVVE
jgi:hypothetical protein